jgi:hypothetical protein
MEKIPNISGRLVVSIRLYRMLLAVYPLEFRQAYGGPMLQVFSDCCRRAVLEAGTAGLLPLWWRTLLDTIKTAIEEHSQRGVYMLRSKFIKLSGWALILGSIALLLGGLASSRPVYDRYNYFSLPIDRYANAATNPLIAMSFLLFSVGYIGLLLRYGQRAGSFGRYSLILGAFSSVISSVSYILLSAYNNVFAWLLFSFSVTIQFLGLVFFGIACLRQCTLPRWNGLPILAGVWLPIFFLTTFLIELASGKTPEYPEVIIFFILLFTLTGLIGLGYLLEIDSQAADRATAEV